MTRRHFLATTAASTLAFAAEPERKWRVAVIGNKGSYGHSLDSMWLTLPETEIVAVADLDAKKLADTLKKLGITKGFAD